jgi:hypothetical protein
MSIRRSSLDAQPICIIESVYICAQRSSSARQYKAARKQRATRVCAWVPVIIITGDRHFSQNTSGASKNSGVSSRGCSTAIPVIAAAASQRTSLDPYLIVLLPAGGNNDGLLHKEFQTSVCSVLSFSRVRECPAGSRDQCGGPTPEM